jgi:hypothetical protein
MSTLLACGTSVFVQCARRRTAERGPKASACGDLVLQTSPKTLSTSTPPPVVEIDMATRRSVIFVSTLAPPPAPAMAAHTAEPGQIARARSVLAMRTSAPRPITSSALPPSRSPHPQSSIAMTQAVIFINTIRDALRWFLFPYHAA